MKNRRNIFALMLLVFIVISCNKDVLKPSDLIHWVENEENGLVERQEFEHYFFEAKYKPIDYVIAIEGRTDELKQDDYSNLKSELEGLQYVDLNIGPLTTQGNALSAGIQDNEEYFERLDYFVTYANQDIFMVQGQDTLLPKLYHFERNYGLAPKNSLLLGFDQGEKEQDRAVYIDDQVLSVGRVKFLFKNTDIQSTPTLKIN
ncbi:MAG: hypothetical protein GQ574_22965 [Crocinitomix sp.]|nr:hypothetical protein [Crocinitomix sp.]